jgi:hypothetical protein
MIDKRTARVLEILSGICADGSYKIIEKAELLGDRSLKVQDSSTLDKMIRHLQDSEMVDVKYIDDKVYCLTVSPKGRVAQEDVRQKGHSCGKINMKMVVIITMCAFIASVAGAFLGTLIGGWLA